MDSDDAFSVSSATSSSSVFSPPQFPLFRELPPEIRHQIYLAALPAPGAGINFFNVHAFPNDHHRANRSDSPAWLYLDLRRLDIVDDDDAVSRYDPSAWVARELCLRRVCREARSVCALRPEHTAVVLLTRPARGLTVRAGDEQLRTRTPATSSLSKNRHLREEPKTRRSVRVHIQDIISLSLENCSFNLVHEESSEHLRGDGIVDGFIDTAPDHEFGEDGTMHVGRFLRQTDGEEDGGPESQNAIRERQDGMSDESLSEQDDNNDAEIGWSYDPKLVPNLIGSPLCHRICFNVARGSPPAISTVADVFQSPSSLGDVPPGQPHDSEWLSTIEDVDITKEPPFLMIDARTRELGDRALGELTDDRESSLYHDRFGDSYLAVPGRKEDRSPPASVPSVHVPFDYLLVKVWPERNNIRERYLQSAMMRSPKRPK